MFFSLTIFTFALELPVTRVNTTEDKIHQIEKEIEELNLKRKALENLKATFIRNKDIKNPKIGLVLSGGGAKGAAHIGVLKTLEKYKIPIDYIVGTSAGSIIAAMYSVGYTPDEIEKIITDLRFDELFINSSNRNLEEMIQKTNSNKYPLNISLTKDFEISLPMGVLNGENIYLTLKSIFAKAGNTTDFKKLPIPFKAITTDLQTGKSVEVEEGDLALAVLKSMAIPSFLDPIKDNNIYYVDGGVKDNFPVLQAIKMGANIVIGVDISAEPAVINDNSNIVQVLDKLSTYSGEKSVKSQRQYSDILITPNVRKHSTLNFSNLPKLVEEGVIASEKLNQSLKKLTDERRFNEIQFEKDKMKNRKFAIKNINLHGNNVLTEKEVKKLKPKKNKLSINEINLWTEKIYAKNYINRVFYFVDGDTINFSVEEKIDPKIKGGLFYISNYGAGLETVAEIPVFNGLNLSQKNYTLKAEFSKYPKVSLRDMAQYNVLSHNLLLSAELQYGLNPIMIYRDGNNISTYKNSVFETDFSIGTTIFDNIIAGYTLSYRDIHTNYDSGEKLKNISFLNNNSYLGNTLALFYDTLNEADYPSTGMKGLVQSFTELNTERGNSFEGYSGTILKCFPITDNWSIHANISGGKVHNPKNATLTELFNIGGLRNNPLRKKYSFVGLPFSSVYTDNFLLGGLGVQYSLSSNLHLNFDYNIATYNANSEFEKEEKIWYMKKQGYGVGIGINTFFGPMDFSISNDVLNHDLLFQVYIGYIF